MAKITIDGVDHDTDTMSEKARLQLLSVQYCEGELRRLQQEMAAIQTAGRNYMASLKEELARDKEGEASKSNRQDVSANDDMSDADTTRKKTGIFSGLFSK